MGNEPLPSSPTAEPKKPPRRPWPRWFWLLFAVILWLSLLRFPAPDDNADIDFSWRLCLAHFCKHQARAGVDYIFTYGPLGYFTTDAYDPDLFWWKYAWELAFAGVLAALFAGLGSLLPAGPLRVGYVFVLVCLLEALPDSLYPPAIVLAVLLPLRAERVPRGTVAAAGAFVALIGLSKFTYLLLGSAGWLLLMAGFARDRGRFVEALLGFPVALLAAWCALGQHPADLPTYLAAAREVSAGYVEAMAVEGSLWRDLLALGLLALLATLALTLRRTPLWHGRRRAALALVALAVLLEWRHGFIRPSSHCHLFFLHARLVPFSIVALAGAAAAGRTSLALTAAAVGLACGGYGQVSDVWKRPTRIVINARDLLTPLALRQRCQEHRDRLTAAVALPRLAARIGDEPVDLLSADQKTLLLNGLRYRPRPVFQSYVAYTPRLLADNAAFFRSERAPRWVLCRLEPIDDHYPTSEDGPALLELLRRYRPVAEEAGVVLLERRADEPRTEPARVVWQGTVDLGEEVLLPEASPGTIRRVKIDVEDTLRGRLTKLVGRPPPLFLRVRHAGGTATYRLIPALARTGFLLDPLVTDATDLARLGCGEALPRLTAFAVSAGSGDPRRAPDARTCYRDRLRIVVEEERGP
jgi:hypothetical protein